MSYVVSTCENTYISCISADALYNRDKIYSFDDTDNYHAYTHSFCWCNTSLGLYKSEEIVNLMTLYTNILTFSVDLFPYIIIK